MKKSLFSPSRYLFFGLILCVVFLTISSLTALQTPVSSPLSPLDGRVSVGLQALYTFEEGGGTVIEDRSGVGTALPLTIANPNAVTWLPGGGLQVNIGSEKTILASDVPAAKITAASQTSNELTIEAWIKPDNVTQDGPARIVTLSQDGYNRNFTLAQGLWDVSHPKDVFNIRLRTTTAGVNGTNPSVTTQSGGGFVTTALTHVVYTRDAAGQVAVYVNGTAVPTDQTTIGGNLSSWDANYRLALADEFNSSEGRTWQGTYYLVAVYDRALSAADVQTNYGAGYQSTDTTPTPSVTPNGTPTATPTRTIANLQVLYTFREGSGPVVHDVADVGAPLDLTIADPNAVSWLSGGGLVVNSAGIYTQIASSDTGAKLTAASQASNELTIEAWIKPDNVTQDGPARIVTLSQDPYSRNFTLAQGLWDVSHPKDVFNIRLRTTTAGVNGTNPSVTTQSGGGFVTTALTHVVYTRDAAGQVAVYVNGTAVPTDQTTIGGNLSNWDANYRLALADEFNSSEGRTWQGTYYLVAIYNRALTPTEVQANYGAGHLPDGGIPTPTPTPVPSGTRVSADLQALYTFAEGDGSVVHDVSGIGDPLDLHIADTNAVTWLPENGLEVNKSSVYTIIASDVAAAKLITSTQGSDEISIEAWIQPDNVNQDGPARIVTLSQDPYSRNFTLAQGLWGSQPKDVFNVRLRTTTTGDNGSSPSVSTASGTGLVNVGLTHVVYTRDAAGNVVVYINGVPAPIDNSVIGGDFSNWSPDYRLALADEFNSSGGRIWQGTYYLVAIYSRALTSTEVQTNFQAGHHVGEVPPPAVWQQVQTAVSPLVIGEYALAYDSSRDRVVLYGGNATGWPYEDKTWEFDGTDWTTVTTTQSPTAVYGAALAYDANRQTAVLFGGSDPIDAPLAETWEYDGSDWLPTVTTNTPPARTYSAMLYDPDTQTTFLFGGNDGVTYYNDLWMYDGSDWQLLPITGMQPVPRTQHTLAYDTATQQILLFGGRDSSGNALNDFWSFDPTTNAWTVITTTTTPSARSGHSMVYLPLTEQLLLIGGLPTDADGGVNDTWRYETSTQWTALTLSIAPPPSAFHTAVYRDADGSVILFTYGQTWRYR